ncbi:HAMP domain-containing sensor histidine kinase [Nitratifractor sp.]|uniref:sensor histidine kinase n=1 Tax=Nitratifractor sp. TaxID=2268144 RepID=UPI0025E2847A|nr:HAMP domain-containing sensor histidine kinase [Nitratifractor sp.]
MLSPKSLRKTFLLRLSAALALLLALFSFVLYHYIRYSVEKELRFSLIKQADYLFAKDHNLERILPRQELLLKRTLHLDARIVHLSFVSVRHPFFRQMKRKGRIVLQGYFPYRPEEGRYLRLEADVTQPLRMVHEVLRAILLLDLIALVLIALYAYFLTRTLIAPIEYFSARLRRMNENLLEALDLSLIPLEFRPLGHSINQLVARIKSHLTYKKELFVGTAHELKTPLAVIKTRSQVALIKRRRSVEDLEKVLRENIETVDRMNRMVGAILQFGRAEGAQFDHPERIDVIAFLRQKAEEFRLLAHSEKKELLYSFRPEELRMTLQPLLLTQIVQNLLQNALRYTPEGGTLRMRSFLREGHFVLEIRDEGPGIDESVDLFAPFRRSKDSPGAGLGLFLVKSAVETLGGTVLLENRRGGRGTVAILTLPLEEGDA